ncbi:carnitine transport ATP-binding protein OpuCA [Arthrobacter sp. Hiyo8]|nr:carnitine transport ATP-binding protein OpuCA [Arthrobacter sp. Hiyo8]
MIKFENVTKAYPDGTVAVDGLNLEAPTGKLTILVGPSGCGKTTSLRMINRLIEPTSGTIYLDDQPTSGMDAALLRRRIGYVIQHAGLFPHRTIVDNVATMPVLLGESRQKARMKALELMERVGLPRASPSATRGNCPVDSSSAWAWPGLWLRIRPSCSWTNPSVPLTPWSAHSSRRSSSGCSARSARPSSWSPTTSMRPSSSATRLP